MPFIVRTKQNPYIYCVVEMKSSVALRQAVHIAIVLIFDKGEDKDTIATRISQTYTRITQEQEARLVKYNNILFFLFRNMARDI
jgi:hypothetical protein